MEERRGIGSVDTAMTVLKAFVVADGPMTLKQVAEATAMPASKLHRYLASLVGQGMLTQPERSGRYDLGPFASQLGLAALARQDFVNRAADAMPDLTALTGATAMLSVWGNGGATVVRWERPARFIVTTLGLGTTLPLRTSATGRVFLAYLPAGLTGPGEAGDARIVDTVRRTGYAAVGGDFIPGLYAVAAPVLDWQGDAQAAITLVDTQPGLIAPDGVAIPALITACRALSLDRPSVASGRRS